MSLGYILRRVASETGVDINSNLEQKVRLLDVINQAATEVYESKDLPVSLRELYLRANSNKELALPPEIGELRAIRSTLQNDNWQLYDIRPRYQNRDWPNKWKNWRIIRYSCFQTELTNVAPGTITYPVEDSTLEITLVGSTSNSNRIVEKIIIDSISKVWTNSFIDFIAIKKNKITTYNVTVKNSEAVEIATIFADQLESRYVIVDVSQYPDLRCCSDGSYIMEVLYKPRLQRLENNDDEFPVSGFDDVIVMKSKQLITEDLPGQENRAILMHQKVTEQISKKTEDKLGTTQKKVKFGRNGLLGLFQKHNRYRY